jgi:hypothetical protein
LADAIAEGQVSAVWPRLARVSAILPDSLAAAVDRNADRRCRQLLARPFDEAWEGDRDLAELRRYLGDAFDQALLESHQSAVEREEDAAPDEATFYRTSQSYLYDLTVFAMSGTKTPYLDAIESVVAPASSTTAAASAPTGSGSSSAGTASRSPTSTTRAPRTCDGASPNGVSTLPCSTSTAPSPAASTSRTRSTSSSTSRTRSRSSMRSSAAPGSWP